MNEFREEGCGSGSWISIRALINESKINSIYSKKDNSCNFGSAIYSPNNDLSITVECKPNTDINQTLCLNQIHNDYFNKTQETWQLKQPDTKSSTYSKDTKSIKHPQHFKDTRHRKFLNSCNKDFAKLKGEVLVLQDKLTKSDEKVKSLTSKIEIMKKEHADELQKIQARHERRLQRNKLDLDELLSKLSKKNEVHNFEEIKRFYKEDMEKIRDYYEDQIKMMKLNIYADRK